MTVSAWLPTTSYAPGARVVPTVRAPVTYTPISNNSFESGTTDYALGSGWSVTSGSAFLGTKKAQITGLQAATVIRNTATNAPVAPGKVINAKCRVKSGNSSQGNVRLVWLDASFVDLSSNDGNVVTDGSSWRESAVTATAPAGAAYVNIAAVAVGSNVFSSVHIDEFAWDHSYVAPESALQYEATQAAAANSGDTEPVWPTTVAATVVDGGVTWTCRNTNRVVWTAFPIMKTGATEPVWPEEVDGTVADNTVSWKAISKRVEDVNCPNTKIVLILAKKIWCGDRDIVRFSATVNPLDWTSANDAGYLPTGLEQAGSPNTTVLGSYRKNLVNFSNSTFQAWEVDPDPANNAILDTIEGIGSSYHKAAVAVVNDMLFLTGQGVRSVSIAAAAANLEAGDVGMPIDSLVRAALVGYTADPLGFYYPAMGQYMLSIDNEIFVYATGVKAWSRFVMPFAIDNFVLSGDRLNYRAGDVVGYFEEGITYDEVYDDEDEIVPTYFDGVIQFPWLDFGQPGLTKMFHGFDIIGTGIPDVQFGYDENNLATFTASYVVEPDTLTDGMISMPISAPSVSVKVTYGGEINAATGWDLKAIFLYLEDLFG